jgi:hypothetical protein
MIEVTQEQIKKAKGILKDNPVAGRKEIAKALGVSLRAARKIYRAAFDTKKEDF